MAYSVPYATRYTWEGTPHPGETVQFSWLLLPHDPAADPAALADGVRFARDDADVVAVRVGSRERAEWAILNPAGQELVLDNEVRTDARRLYLEQMGERLVRYWASEATFLEVGGTEVFRGPGRAEWTEGEVGE